MNEHNKQKKDGIIKIDYDTSGIEKAAENAHQLKLKKIILEAGLLGRFFGSGKTARTNICALISISLIVIGIPTIFCNSTINSLEYWKTIVPILTLSLGYLFGGGE